MPLIRLLVRLVVVPVKLALETVRLAFRMGLSVGRVPVWASRRVTRLLGWRAVVLFVAGVAIGLLVAPVRGRELRERLTRVLGAGAGAGGPQLAERVGFELAHAPRTWHLPQPDVEVADGEVTLRGVVPHEDGREELLQTAKAVPGVVTVRDELVVDEPTA